MRVVGHPSAINGLSRSCRPCDMHIHIGKTNKHAEKQPETETLQTHPGIVIPEEGSHDPYL